jgi:hypothetical protein
MGVGTKLNFDKLNTLSNLHLFFGRKSNQIILRTRTQKKILAKRQNVICLVFCQKKTHFYFPIKFENPADPLPCFFFVFVKSEKRKGYLMNR